MEISKNTQDILNKVYSDNHVTPAEIMEVRDHARNMRDEIASLDGEESPVVVLLDNLHQLSETMQENMLSIRTADYSDLGKMQLLSSIENYLALLKANFNAYKN